MADNRVNLSSAEYETHLIKSYVKETGVDALDLNRAELGMEEIEVILESLVDSQVTDLNLSGNCLAGGVERLAELLVKTKVKTLNVSFCGLSKTDMVHFKKILKNSLITGLNFSYNKCKPSISAMEEFCSGLLSSKITYLNLSSVFDKKVRPRVFSVLFSSLPGTVVKELHVAHNRLLLRELQVLGECLRNSKVEVLDLCFTFLDNDGLNALIPGLVNSSVTKLNLRQNKISDWTNLCKCLKDTQIKSLDLRDNNYENEEGCSFSQFIEGSCLEELKFGNMTKEVVLELMRGLKCSNLKKLEVNLADFNSDIVSEFASVVKFTNITDINFSACKHSVEALSILGECLVGSKLKHINLYNVLLPNTTQAMLAIAVAAFIEKTKGSCVKFLNLSNNELGEVGANIIAPKLAQTTLTHLDLSYNCMKSSVLNIVTNLKFTSITNLNLCNNSIANTDMNTLAEHLKETQITELNIGFNDIASAGAKALAVRLKDTKLLSLDLSCNKIQSDGLEALAAGAENTLITEIDVSLNPGTSRKSFSIIRIVLWKNRASVQPFIDTFQLLAPSGTDNILQFDPNIDNADVDGFIDKVLVVYETIVQKPYYVNILAKEKSISLSTSEILTLMLDKFPKQFSLFLNRSIEADLSQHINLLERIEKSGLSVLVECLLLNRPTYIIDEEQGILHPYVYLLLKKYKQPMYNLLIEPEAKTRIIDYFTEHSDLEYASDVLDFLRQK